MSVAVSDHGRQRTKERFGVSKRIAEDVADRARTDGLRRQDTSGSLRRYMDWLKLGHPKNAEPVIYGGRVWLFAFGTLITVLPIQQRYRRIAEAQLRERRATP